MPKINEQDLINQEAAAFEAATPTQEQVAEQLVIGVEEDVLKAGNEVLAEGMATSNPGSFKRKQIESLKSFFDSPVSYGAVVGQALAGIVGGSQAGAAATPIAMGFNQMANQRYMQNKTLDMQQKLLEQRQDNQQSNRSNLQATQDVIDVRTNESLSYDKRLGKYINQEGTPVPTQFQRNLKIDREERLDKNQAKSLSQRDTSISITKEALDFRKEESKDLSAKQQETIQNAEVAIDQTKELLTSFKDPVIGPVVGRAQTMAQVWTGRSDPAFTRLKTQTDLLLQAYGKAMSGTAMSDNERARLEKTLPSVNDSPQNFKIKAEEFEKQLKRIKSVTIETSSKYQGRGPGVVEKQSAKPVKEIERRTKDGKIAIFDEETKQFLRYK